MTDQTILTQEGKLKLEEELNNLKNVKRKEITERIELAKEHGDLSENAEYQEARNEQSFMEGRILEIENILKNSIMAKSNGKGHVEVGSKVTAEFNGQEIIYSIVGSHEGDPTLGMLSCDSPLGQSLLGKKVGEIASVETPNGTNTYKVKKID